MLKQISDPPEVLYVKGELPKGRMIAVVGTRKMTAFGQKVTEELVAGLVKAKFIIVSGMALGVDGVAHQTAIDCGGETVAVLGAGVELIYPAQHRELYNSIIEHGAVISEINGAKTVVRERFPARNRIISGLCEAVIVTQSDIRSGSLITARVALDQGRDVFAVSGSPGPDYLISCGARAVTNIDDIIKEIS